MKIINLWETFGFQLINGKELHHIFHDVTIDILVPNHVNNQG